MQPPGLKSCREQRRPREPGRDPRQSKSQAEIKLHLWMWIKLGTQLWLSKKNEYTNKPISQQLLQANCTVLTLPTASFFIFKVSLMSHHSNRLLLKTQSSKLLSETPHTKNNFTCPPACLREKSGSCNFEMTFQNAPKMHLNL